MKIFVSIISLRDPLLEKTVDSLIANKSNRHQATYCIFEQTSIEYALCTIRPDLVERADVVYKRIDPQYAEGVGWPRYINQLQITDEDFFFQVDSHMLFDPNWDRIQVENYKEAVLASHGHKDIVLSASCKNFAINEAGELVQDSHPEKVTAVLKYFDIDKNTSIAGAHGDMVVNAKAPIPAVHLCAGNLFTTTKWVKDVGNDPNILFECEEQLLTLKSFAAGYKMYHPTEVIAYHYVDTHNYITKIWVDPVVPKHIWHNKSSKAVVLFNKYLDEIPESVLVDYYKYSGLDYINKSIDEDAKSKTMFMPPSEPVAPPPPVFVEEQDRIDLSSANSLEEALIQLKEAGVDIASIPMPPENIVPVDLFLQEQEETTAID